MFSIASMGTNLADDERLSTGYPRQPGDSQLIARFVSIRERLKSETDTGDLDALAAPWFDAALKACKASAVASQLGVSEAHLSYMRSGKKAVPIRALIPLTEYPQAVIAFCRGMCEAAQLEPPSPRRQLTVDDLRDLALRLFIKNPTLLNALVEEAAMTKGADPEETMRVLAGERR